MPGGGVDSGESLHDALHREMKEEVGWRIEIGREVGSAAEFVYTSDDNKAYNKIGHFFVCSVVDSSGSRTELDHEPVWVTVKEFAGNAAHESHVWAIEQCCKDL